MPATGDARFGLSSDARRSLRHHQMRIRTVAVSFGAAVASARRDMDAPAAEIDAMIETWRTWSHGMLEEYAAEARAMTDPVSDEEADAHRRIDDELVAAYRIVGDA
jgi:hypothetical protein